MWRVWLVTWLALNALLFAVYTQLVVTLFQERGNHLPYNGNVTIVLEPSLSDDVRAMLDVTSISQWGVETDAGQYTVTWTVVPIVIWLTAAELCARKKDDTGVHGVTNSPAFFCVCGYLALLLVGLFGTALPQVGGDGPRRGYNVFYVWRVPDEVSAGFHLTGAVAFLFVPLIARMVEVQSRRWRAVFGVALAINVGFVCMQIAAEYDTTGELVDNVDVVVELVAFGPTSWALSGYLLHWLQQLESEAAPVKAFVQYKTVATSAQAQQRPARRWRGYR